MRAGGAWLGALLIGLALVSGGAASAQDSVGEAVIESHTPGVLLVRVDGEERGMFRRRAVRVAPGEHAFVYGADGVFMIGVDDAHRYTSFLVRFEARDGRTYSPRLAAGYNGRAYQPTLNVAEMILCIDERQTGAPRAEAQELLCMAGADFIAARN